MNYDAWNHELKKRVENATFFLLSYHPRFYRRRGFLFWNFLEHCPRGEKKFASFSCVCFPGVHFTAFGVLEHAMNAVFALHRHKVRVVFYFLYVLLSVWFARGLKPRSYILLLLLHGATVLVGPWPPS